MVGSKGYSHSDGSPLRWRIIEHLGRLFVVESDMAPPIMQGQSLVWEGPARHMVEAYRNARAAGLPIYLTKDGFRLRKGYRES